MRVNRVERREHERRSGQDRRKTPYGIIPAAERE